MYRIAVYVWPDGDVESKVQCDPKSKTLLDAMALYAKLETPILHLKEEVRKSISTNTRKLKNEKRS